MKVLHFLDSLDRGGAEAQALDVCRNAARYGLEMTLVTANGGAMESEFQASGVEYIRLSRMLPMDVRLVSQLRRIIREREIEIVHGYQPVDGLHLFLATRGLKNVKTVLSFQGFIQDRKNRITARFLIPRVGANIAVSRGMLKWLAEVDRLETSRRFTVIYNGADPSRVAPTGKSLRTELDLGPDSLLIGMVGNFYRDPRKDQLTICRALPAVFREFSNVHCVFAGQAEAGAEDKLAACVDLCREHAIVDRVHFLGGRSDVPDILAALDVFVFSSLHEGLPLAVSEAMLAGVPMIVSDIEPLLEVTGGGEFAGVFPVGDEKVLAEKLIGLLGDRGRRNDLAHRAEAFAVANFSIDAHLSSLLKLYRSLIETR